MLIIYTCPGIIVRKKKVTLYLFKNLTYVITQYSNRKTHIHILTHAQTHTQTHTHTHILTHTQTDTQTQTAQKPVLDYRKEAVINTKMSFFIKRTFTRFN